MRSDKASQGLLGFKTESYGFFGSFHLIFDKMKLTAKSDQGFWDSGWTLGLVGFRPEPYGFLGIFHLIWDQIESSEVC